VVALRGVLVLNEMLFVSISVLIKDARAIAALPSFCLLQESQFIGIFDFQFMRCNLPSVPLLTDFQAVGFGLRAGTSCQLLSYLSSFLPILWNIIFLHLQSDCYFKLVYIITPNSALAPKLHPFS
jgi:hypothetical protein